MTDECHAIQVQINALEKMMTEREERTKERLEILYRNVSAAFLAAEKAVDKAEGAQQLRNAQQNEFRQALADLSKLMWTRQEGEAAVEALRRELTQAITNMERRVSTIEGFYANLQGRMWAISAIWAIIVLATSIGVRFIGH